MKRMHKWMLAMLLILTVLLAGCGNKQEHVAGTITPNETQITTAEAAEEENPVALGQMEGGIYTNTYAGFGCELDSEWVYYSAEQLQELPENVEELIKDSKLGEAIADAAQIFDMQAENITDLTTMNVVYTKLGIQERLAYAMMSEEQILDLILGQSDTLTEAYTQAGFEVLGIEKVKVNFLGEERSAVRTSATIQGVNYYILQVYDYNLGQLGVTLTVGSYVEDKTEELLNLFYAVEE